VNLTDTRRANLRTLIEQHGGVPREGHIRSVVRLLKG
jgi:hypothetical protein